MCESWAVSEASEASRCSPSSRPPGGVEGLAAVLAAGRETWVDARQPHEQTDSGAIWQSHLGYALQYPFPFFHTQPTADPIEPVLDPAQAESFCCEAPRRGPAPSEHNVRAKFGTPDPPTRPRRAPRLLGLGGAWRHASPRPPAPVAADGVERFGEPLPAASPELDLGCPDGTGRLLRQSTSGVPICREQPPPETLRFRREAMPSRPTAGLHWCLSTRRAPNSQLSDLVHSGNFRGTEPGPLLQTVRQSGWIPSLHKGLHLPRQTRN